MGKVVLHMCTCVGDSAESIYKHRCTHMYTSSSLSSNTLMSLRGMRSANPCMEMVTQGNMNLTIKMII